MSYDRPAGTTPPAPHVAGGDPLSGPVPPAYGTPGAYAAPAAPPTWGSQPPPGAPQPGAPAMPGAPMSLGARFLARLIDAVVSFAILAGCVGLGSLLESYPVATWVLAAFGLVMWFGGYEYVLTAMFGQTVGKRVMQMQIVTIDGGGVPGWGRAAGRSLLVVLLSVVTGGLAGLLFYLSPLFDSTSWKRGWHDKIAGTVVVAR